MFHRTTMACLALTSILFAPSLWGQSSLSIGVELNGIGWTGDNGRGNSRFDSDRGGQFGYNISWLKDSFYLGLSLQGGDYDFDRSAPTQFTENGPVTVENETISHSDFDLLAGYYFWDQVSLFLDLKGVGSRWKNNDYEQSFGGLGFGVAGFHPVNEKWTIYGSLGFVGGDIKDKSKTVLGEAYTSALIVGTNYSLDESNYLKMGFKSRSFVFDYDDGNDQDYELNGLFFGYNHVFEL